MSAAILIVFTLLIAYILYFYLWKVRQYPKGPFPLPFIGNLLTFPKDHIQNYMDDLSKIYGPCYTVWLPLPIVVLTDYSHIKDAFVTQPDAFIQRANRLPETLLQAHDNVGILISSGDNWRMQRRAALKILREFGLGKNIMEQQVVNSINEMMEQISELPDKSNVDLFWPIQLCVGNVINESLFGYHFSYKKPEKFQMFVNKVDYHLRNMRSGASFLLMAFPWLKHFPIVGERGYHIIERNMKEIQKFIESEVDEQVKNYQEDSEPENFVHAYLKEMRKPDNTDLDMKNLYASSFDFWAAGMETTSNSLRWHIAYMMKYPDIQDKVRAEILEVVGTSRHPSMADKPNLPYTQAVIHEVQRHSNMISLLLTHCSVQDVTVCGNPIPAGTSVFAQIFSVLRNDSVFEDPLAFNSSRYLLEDGKTFDKKVLERTIPFSIGKRACVGEGLARMELFLIFSALIQKYQYIPKEPIDISPVSGGVLTAKPYKCKLIPVF